MTDRERLFTEPANAADSFAEVIIPLALPLNYTWAIPAHLKDAARVGCRVEVNLGRSKKYAGIIKKYTIGPRNFLR